MGYHAQVTFAYLVLRGRWRRRLEDAVDDHAVLLAAKVRALGAVETTGLAEPEEVMRDALSQLYRADVACRIVVSMPSRYSHYLIGRSLASPSYNSSSPADVSAALNAWREFQLASETGCRSPGTGGRGTAFRAPPGAPEVWEKWLHVRAAYLGAWAARDAEVGRLATDIDGLMAGCASKRERDWELHEAACMAREERRQRVDQAAAVRRQAASTAKASRRKPPGATRAARARGRRAAAWAASREDQELRCLRRLAALTMRWSAARRAA